MESPLLGGVGNQRRPQCNDPDSRRVTLKEVVGRPVWQAGAPNGFVSSKYLFFRQIFAGWKMSLEGKCCWAKDNSGCVRQLMSRIAGMCSLWKTSFPPPPPPKGWISPLGHAHFPSKPPTVSLNFALWPHPNWPVMSGHTSADKLPSKSNCRL